MPLQKGFLRKPKYRFHKQFVITSILLAIGHTIAWYYFLVVFKEAIRVSSYSITDYLLVLTTEENYFFNWFYANLALNIGLSYGIKFFMENAFLAKTKSQNLSRKFIINNQFFISWNYILWFTKLLSLYSVWVVVESVMFFELNAYNELFWFLILFNFVWFTNLWLGIQRLHIKRSWLAPVITFIIVQIFSGLIAFNNVLEIDEINTNLISNNTLTKYKIELTEYDLLYTNQLSRLRFKTNLYVSKNKIGSGFDSNIVFEDTNNYTLTEYQKLRIEKYVFIESQKLYEFDRDQMVIFLHVDKDVKLKTVNQLKELLSENYGRRICMVILPQTRKYPKDYPGYRTYGFYERLPLNCQEVKDQIDSLSNLGYKSANLKFRHKYYCYRGLDFNNWNRFKVTLNSKNEIHINYSAVTENDLFNWTFSFFKKYGSKGIVLFDVDENVTFEQYLKTKSNIYNAIILNRIIEARKLFNVDYTQLDWFNPVDYDMKIKIDPKFPVNIVELSETDKFLYEFSKK